MEILFHVIRGGVGWVRFPELLEVGFQNRECWCSLGVNDTPVFLLNEYIVELNPANFNILNQILNWISLNLIMFWIEFCPKFSYWIFYWIEFCPKISYWIFYWTESGLKTENQLYFESILWYYTLKYPKNTPKCLIMP